MVGSLLRGGLAGVLAVETVAASPRSALACSGPPLTFAEAVAGSELIVEGTVTEVLLVLDATTGQNGLIQARVFSEAVAVTGIVLTKLDVLTGIDRIPVAVAYDVDGVIKEEVPVSQSDFHHAKPVYEEFPGWTEDISGAREFSDLPPNAQSYVRELEAMSGARFSAIGVGPKRDEIIQRHDLLG